jgi:cardiolipin synthase
MLRAIAGARDHVNLEIFVFADDAVGREVADALLRKQAEGVQVNLLYDSLGSEKTPRAFFDRLAAGGIAVREYNPVARGLAAYARRDHRKILVVDGELAFTGGINISAAYAMSSGALRRRQASPTATAGLRDTSVEVRGPAVAAFQRLFLDLWRSGGGRPLAARTYFPAPKAEGGALVRVIGSGPGKTRGAMYLTLLSALAAARKSAYLTTGFFVPDRQLLEALSGAARRGVDVQLLVPGFTDHPVVQAAGRAHYAALLQHGVRIHEEQDVLLHAKTAVIDDVWSSVGSTNLDPWSFVRNLESDAVILDAAFGGRMRALFEADRSRAITITPTAWAERPLGARLLETYASLWSGLF